MGKPLLFAIIGAFAGATAAHFAQEFFLSAEGASPNPAISGAIGGVMGLLGFRRGLSKTGGS